MATKLLLIALTVSLIDVTLFYANSPLIILSILFILIFFGRKIKAPF